MPNVAVHLPVNSPVGDSQSNGRVENAIKKVRNMVKTILSSLESRWCIRVTRDYPVYSWMSEWAGDLMTRYAHVGDLGKDSTSIDPCFKVKQKHCAIRRKDLVQTASSRRAHYEDELKKDNGTMNSTGPSKENLDNLFLGSTVTRFLQQFRTEQEYTWKKIRQMLVWDNKTKVSIHRKHGKFRCHQTDLLPKYAQIR